ncbi:helix-turn-helix domain-containing protein [Candidatus Bathyarchaeota archaeon]|nr:helix-turn-helix domain-containing protein [Candidatus Bathyarchaeota archaeon]
MLKTQAVKILNSPKQIKALADPLRREILRKLVDKPLTQSQLAEELDTSPSAIAYHLNLLSRLGLIRIQRTEIEEHGIQEKFYEPTARLFIEDYRSIPEKYRKRLLQIHIERVRGVLALIKYLKGAEYKEELLSRVEVEKIAEKMAENLTDLGYIYEKEDVKLDRESLIIELYSKALEYTINQKDGEELKLLIQGIKNSR